VHNGSRFALSRIAPAPLLPVRKPSLTVFGERSRAFIKYFRIEQIFPIIWYWIGLPALEFASASPSIVKSIRQRDLLNSWLRALCP
jgi:hypothetical protein